MATRRSAAPAVLAATALLLLTGCGPIDDSNPAAMPEQRGDTATGTLADDPDQHDHAQEVTVDDEDFPVVLGVTNQSFDDPDVGLVVTVDGTVRVDRSFAVEGQHTVTHFGLDLQPGTHTVTVSSDSGATAETTFVLPDGDRRWVYVTYWNFDPAKEGVSWGGDEQPGPAVEVMVSEEIVPIA